MICVASDPERLKKCTINKMRAPLWAKLYMCVHAHCTAPSSSSCSCITSFSHVTFYSSHETRWDFPRMCFSSLACVSPYFQFLLLQFWWKKKKIEQKNINSYAATSTFELHWDKKQCHRLTKNHYYYYHLVYNTCICMQTITIRSLCEITISFHFSVYWKCWLHIADIVHMRKKMRAIEKEQLNC